MPLPRVLVLAPHHDDTALSLGSTLWTWAGAPIPIHVVNCFTRSAWAPCSETHGSVEAVSSLRCREDEAFLSSLGGHTRATNLGCLDAPLRRPGTGVFDHDEETIRSEARALVEALQPVVADHRHDLWVLPMGLGGHVDHVITREAGLQLAADSPIAFFEDIPYALPRAPEEICRSVGEIMRATGLELNLLETPFDDDRLSAWYTAVRFHESQFTNHEVLCIARALLDRGGEHLWTTRAFRERLP